MAISFWQKRILGLAVGLVASGLLLYLSLRDLPLSQFMRELDRVNVPILLLSEVTKFIALILLATRIRSLLAPFHNYSLGLTFRAQLLLFAANTLLPLRLGELLRIHYLAIHGEQPHSTILTATVAERFLDLVVLVLLFFGMVALSDRIALGSSMVLIAFFVGAGVMAIAAVNRYPTSIVRWSGKFFATMARTGRIGRSAEKFVAPKFTVFVRELGSLASPQRSAVVFLIACAYWAAQCGSIAIWIWAWGLDLPRYAPLFILLHLIFGTAIPSSPGYIGTFHYFAIVALTSLGVNHATAASFAIVAHVMALGPFTVIAITVAIVEHARGRLFSLRVLGNIARSPDKDMDVRATSKI